MINIDLFKGFKHEVLLCKSFKPRKSLVYAISTIELSNKRLELGHQYHVYDKFDKLVFTGNHLSFAISAYNDLK